MNQFRPLDTAADAVLANAAFLCALRAWSKRPAHDFPTSAPPIDPLVWPGSPENEELAVIFMLLAKRPTLTDQLVYLCRVLDTHERLLACLLSTPGTVTAPYEAMVATLKRWVEALSDSATQEHAP